MMLDHLGIPEPAERIRRAVTEVYASGHLTVDVGGRHDTRSFSDLVVAAVR
jgi:isocitrate/isopropylmalate dehydrogenase